MEELARLQASRRAYRSHVTRILNKVEETLATTIDELAITYLNTAVTQLEKKKEQIVQLDQQIFALIQDATALEESIMDSEELQDTILEKVNELNKRVELFQLQTPTNSRQGSGEDHGDTTQESDHENVSEVASTLPISSCDAPITTVISGPPVVCSAYDTPVTNVISGTPAIYASPGASSTIVSNPSLTLPMLDSISSYSTSPVSLTSVSYVYGSGPPPLIPRVIHTTGPASSSLAGHPSPLLPSLSTLNLGISSSHSLAGIPSINTITSETPLGVTLTTTATGGHNQSQQFAMCRLPKLTLPTFSGNPLHWLTFWDSFQAAIDLNPNLSGVQKFNYLKAQLEGDAARTIEGFPLTDRNYLHAVTILQDRFGQPHKVIAAHMRALLEIAKPTNNLTSLRAFHDTIESHSRGLSSLGKSEETYGDLFVPIILGKLPKEIRQNLARETATSEWTFPQLMSAILKEIRILETGGDDLHRSQPHTTAAFLVNSKLQSSKPRLPPSCVFCKGPHSAYQCTTVTDHQRRLDIVKQNHLCFNCLAKHKVSQCSSKFRCRHCKRKHHTSLCNGDHRTDIPRTTSQVTHPPATPQHTLPPTTTATPVSLGSFLIPASHHTTPICLLKTAIAPVISSDASMNANILFDEGAQRSFICSQLANKLNIVPSTTTQVALSSFGNDSPSFQRLGVATVQIQTLNGDLVPISVLIVPKIATPIQNSCRVEMDNMPHLKGLKLANPITDSDEFLVSILIGADYYWSFIQDHIVRGEDPLPNNRN